MRKWHRWLAVVFGIFLFWIAITGFGIQFVTLTQGGDEHEAPAAAAAAPAGFACPEGWSCRPPRPKAENDAHEAEEFLMHLHSGEAFGPLGTALSVASSLALLFFAVSGMWMYLKMWRGRRRGAKGRLFWS